MLPETAAPPARGAPWRISRKRPGADASDRVAADDRAAAPAGGHHDKDAVSFAHGKALSLIRLDWSKRALSMDSQSVSFDGDAVTGDRGIGREDAQTGVVGGLAFQGIAEFCTWPTRRARVFDGTNEVCQHDSPTRPGGDLAAMHVVAGKLDVIAADEDSGDDRWIGMNPEAIVRELQMGAVFPKPTLVPMNVLREKRP